MRKTCGKVLGKLGYKLCKGANTMWVNTEFSSEQNNEQKVYPKFSDSFPSVVNKMYTAVVDIILTTRSQKIGVSTLSTVPTTPTTSFIINNQLINGWIKRSEQ